MKMTLLLTLVIVQVLNEDGDRSCPGNMVFACYSLFITLYEFKNIRRWPNTMQLMILNTAVRLHNVVSHEAIIWGGAITFTCCSADGLICSFFIVRANVLQHCHLVMVRCITRSMLRLFICFSTYLTENTHGKAGKVFSVLSSFFCLIVCVLKNTVIIASMKNRMWLTLEVTRSFMKGDSN